MGGKLCEDTAILLTPAREGFRVLFPDWLPILLKALGRQAKGTHSLDQRGPAGPCGLSLPSAVFSLHSALLSLTPGLHTARPALSHAHTELGPHRARPTRSQARTQPCPHRAGLAQSRPTHSWACTQLGPHRAGLHTAGPAHSWARREPARTEPRLQASHQSPSGLPVPSEKAQASRSV